MDWLARMQSAMDYIEANLDGDINVTRLARIMNCSGYQFARMFALLTDVPLSEYIRRRRLTQAAFDLQNSDMKIIDAALKYGYDSPTAFTRAFLSIHGVTPSRARREGTPLTSFPRMSFHISIKGDVSMNYRIEQRDSFRVVGIKENVSKVNDESYRRIPQIWEEAHADGTEAKILELMEGEPSGWLGICADFDHEANAFDYYIASVTNKPIPDGMHELTIPACTWAIFEAVGPPPVAIQNIWKRIYSEWFPSSGYMHGMGPEIEVYPEGDPTSPEYKTEIWIPITK